MKHLLTILLILSALLTHAHPRSLRMSGRVAAVGDGAAVPYATVVLPAHGLWAVADARGEFAVAGVPAGEVEVVASCLGYVRQAFRLCLAQRDTADVVLSLARDNLSVGEVTVTAVRKADDAGTAYTISRQALAHVQVLNLANAMSLLPGGRSVRAPHFASDVRQTLALRAASTQAEGGNPTFGTAVEVDGVRMSANGSFGSATAGGTLQGADTRTVATANVERIEVVAGVPSVEYGDLTDGIVKVSTRSGCTPWEVEATVQPYSKLVALGKGFSLGTSGGTLNVSAERARSISALASPYTSYVRNAASLSYANTLRRGRHPLRVEAGLSAHLGGYDARRDPDAFADTYTSRRASGLTARVRLEQLLGLPWLTSVEMSASLSASRSLYTARANKSASSATASLRGLEEGYFAGSYYDEHPEAEVVLIPAGYWYQQQHIDSRPLRVRVAAKAQWRRQQGRWNSHLSLGGDYVAEGDRGRGEYYADMRYAPTYRPYPYREQPLLHSASGYVEESLGVRLSPRASLLVTGGVRGDVARTARSDYGAVGSLSPRAKAKLTLRGAEGSPMRGLTLRAGWGRGAKLPSMPVLYPAPQYESRQAFAPGTMADGSTYYAYYMRPFAPLYNPSLLWQYAEQAEVGAELTLGGVRLSATAYRKVTRRSYLPSTSYSPYTYRFTGPGALEQSAIPSEDRQYSIDRATGIVTVADRTGARPAEVLPYTEHTKLRASSTYVNGSPVVRHGLEWVAELGKVRALHTAVRLDGAYYRHRSAEQTLLQDAPAAQVMADGRYYRYVGYYTGGSAFYNGSLNHKLTANLTLTTHIAALRLIVSLRVEGTLLDVQGYRSEQQGGGRSYALSSRSDLLPAADRPEDIYSSRRYTATYPLYYTSLDAPDRLIPFLPAFAHAREHDVMLYHALASLVKVSPRDYSMRPASLSPYASANLSITKELGTAATLTFTATNFTNTRQTVRNSATGAEVGVEEALVPEFYYGVTVKIAIGE